MDSSETRRVEALNEALDEAMRPRRGRAASNPRANASDHTRSDPEVAALLETAARLRDHRPAPRASFDARMQRAIAAWPAADDARAGKDGSDAEGASDTATLATTRTSPDPRLRTARRIALRAAGVAAAVALTFGGLRAVSADSGPGDLLWPVQRAVRQVERVVSEAAASLPSVLRRAQRETAGGEGPAAVGGAATAPTATTVARRGDRGEALQGATGEQRSAATDRGATSARATEAAARAGALAFAALAATADAAATSTAPPSMIATQPIALPGEPTSSVAPGSVAPAEPTPKVDARDEEGQRSSGGGSSGGSSGGEVGPAPDPGQGEQTPSPELAAPTPSATSGTLPTAPATSEPTATTTATPPNIPPITPPSETPGPSGACRGQIVGRITLPDGSPVPGARVYAMAWPATDPLPPPATPWPDPVPDPSGREPVASGLDGAYRHAGLCAGEYAIFAMIELPMGRLQGMHERSAGNPLIRLERSDSIVQGIDVRLQPVAPPDPNVGPTPPGSGARPPGAATATATASAISTATATATATATTTATATP